MKKEINLFGRQYEFLAVVLMSFTIVTLIMLGNWQISRLHKKEHFINSISSNVENDAIDLTSTETPKPYDKVSLSGHFLSNKNVFLYGRRSASPEKDGYYLLSAFASDSGKTYVISRGWFPQSLKHKLQEGIIEQDHETLEAIILPGEKKNYFVPENDQKNKVWFTLDLNMASKVINTNVQDFYLMQIDSTTLPSGVVSLKTTHLNKVRNDHLEYAITWYSLAACLLVIFMIYGGKSNAVIFNASRQNVQK